MQGNQSVKYISLNKTIKNVSTRLACKSPRETILKVVHRILKQENGIHITFPQALIHCFPHSCALPTMI